MMQMMMQGMGDGDVRDIKPIQQLNPMAKFNG